MKKEFYKWNNPSNKKYLNFFKEFFYKKKKEKY